ncbi:MAG: dienelactone hydrolase family protein [Methylocystaceae bacterium]|nr:dienelactone hydrolase family protein [Methylocystaceae bacterium]
MTRLNGPHLPPAMGNGKHLVIMLHGFGADGADLISLAPFFQQQLPDTIFHSPNGPQACELSPLGRQWFSLAKYDSEYLRRNTATQDIAFEAMYDGALEAAPIIESYIDDLMSQYKLSRQNVILMGFSQGTMMALHVGLRQQTPFAGIIGFSGALVGASHLKRELTSPCPILLIHGEADEMLPVHAVDLAAQGLQNVNLTPTVLKRPALPHSIDEEGALAAALFMKEQLNEQA